MEKKIIKQKIKNHYRQANLEVNIKAAFENVGLKISDYTDTESLDEFHVRGRQASRELARLADLKKGMRVLDLGCGIGGAARMLAAEFGCVVTGIDLVEEYCQTAAMITEQTGLSHMVGFQIGDMTALSFDDQSFDAAWTLHTIMNIKDKTNLFNDIFRILQSGGLFAFYEICSGSNFPPHFPVPWATDASMNFLLRPDDFRLCLMKRGFVELQWQDASEASIAWFKSMTGSRRDSEMKTEKRVPEAKKKRPGISMLMGKNAAEKSHNVFRNLTEDRIRTIFGVFRKPEKV